MGLARSGLRVQTEVDKVTRKHAYIGLAKVRQFASGRPGPRRRTGDYVRSWNVQLTSSVGLSAATLTGGVTARIGTNAPQARRLELGFFGEDSLGRSYRQRAYPHVAPTRRAIERPYRREVAEAVVKVMREWR